MDVGNWCCSADHSGKALRAHERIHNQSNCVLGVFLFHIYIYSSSGSVVFAMADAGFAINELDGMVAEVEDEIEQASALTVGLQLTAVLGIVRLSSQGAQPPEGCIKGCNRDQFCDDRRRLFGRFND